MATQLFDLTGKIALVSGASRGIGEEIAKLLAEQGAHVIVSSRKIDDCSAVAEGIRQGGAKIIHNVAHPVDQFPAVHARAGEPCFVCGTIIEKTRVGGRGTYLCPTCQPDPGP